MTMNDVELYRFTVLKFVGLSVAIDLGGIIIYIYPKY